MWCCGVDPARARDLVELLMSLASESGATLVMSIHDIALAGGLPVSLTWQADLDLPPANGIDGFPPSRARWARLERECKSSRY